MSDSSEKKPKLPAVVPQPQVPATIQPADPLQRYMLELSRHPVLDPEIQIEMAKELKETGNLEIARKLVTTNLRLVVKIAMEYKNSYQNVLDLIQEGNVGLMKAVANYDPYKGTRLSYYASWWIRSYILKFLLDNFRLVKVGTTQAQKKLFYNLMREKERLEAQGIAVGPKLLAEKLDVKESEVEEMNLRLSSAGSEVSLDRPIDPDGDGKATAISALPSQETSIDVRLMQNQLESKLNKELDSFMSQLNEKERAVLQQRLLQDEPATLQEIADIFGLSRERARQIEEKVIEKLRNHLRSTIDGLPELKQKKRKSSHKRKKKTT